MRVSFHYISLVYSETTEITESSKWNFWSYRPFCNIWFIAYITGISSIAIYFHAGRNTGRMIAGCRKSLPDSNRQEFFIAFSGLRLEEDWGQYECESVRETWIASDHEPDTPAGARMAGPARQPGDLRTRADFNKRVKIYVKGRRIDDECFL